MTERNYGSVRSISCRSSQRLAQLFLVIGQQQRLHLDEIPILLGKLWVVRHHFHEQVPDLCPAFIWYACWWMSSANTVINWCHSTFLLGKPSVFVLVIISSNTRSNTVIILSYSLMYCVFFETCCFSPNTNYSVQLLTSLYTGYFWVMQETTGAGWCSSNLAQNTKLWKTVHNLSAIVSWLEHEQFQILSSSLNSHYTTGHCILWGTDCIIN